MGETPTVLQRVANNFIGDAINVNMTTQETDDNAFYFLTKT